MGNREIEDTMRDNARIWEQSALVRLQEAAPLVRIMCDELASLRTQLARAEAVLSLLIEATCGGEVVTPNDALATAKPLSWYESAGELSTMVVYDAEEGTR
jgi:hypothetical protein